MLLLRGSKMNLTRSSLLQNKHANLPWLEDNTILLTKHGSQAYGLNTPASDLDVKGIAIAPIDYYLGYGKVFEQAEGKAPEFDCEYVIFELRKFVKLAADCNPNVIELLFTDEEDLIYISKLGRKLRENRNVFVTKKAKHTFSGYAMAQLKRIKGHRAWLLNPPKAPPTRAEFGLPERTVIPSDQLAAAQASIKKQLDKWEFKEFEELDPSNRLLLLNAMSESLAEISIGYDEKFRAAGRILGMDDNFLELLDRERHYRAQQTTWEQYQNWKRTRNEARAELEAKFGYDTKHAMHLVRLMRMCEEILTTGQVNVKRDDREELLAIRRGEWEYDRLIEWAEQQDAKLSELYKTSTLPHGVDKEWLNTFQTELIISTHYEKYKAGD